MKPSTSAKPKRRPALPRVSDEMRQWSDLLLHELLSWPKVTTRPMFGMTALYRGEAIFAVVPRTRAMDTAYSVSFKLRHQSESLARRLTADERIVNATGKMAGWISFELSSGNDIPDAVEWFARAYEQAAKR